jgi:uncharacterized membrane protein YfcA
VEVGLLMLGAGVVAGVFGSLLGLGGGTLIVPLLTLAFGLPVREAVGVSLVCVIMTSGASAAVYLERDVANLRLGMVLELFTATGAVVGGAIAFLLDEHLLAGLFAVMLVYVSVSMARQRQAAEKTPVAPPPDESAAEPLDVARPGASRAPATPSGGFDSVLAAACSRASCRPSSASAGASSRSRSCTSRWASRCGSPPRPATS